MPGLRSAATAAVVLGSAKAFAVSAAYMFTGALLGFVVEQSVAFSGLLRARGAVCIFAAAGDMRLNRCAQNNSPGCLQYVVNLKFACQYQAAKA